jgi:hypothetical protein
VERIFEVGGTLVVLQVVCSHVQICSNTATAARPLADLCT